MTKYVPVEYPSSEEILDGLDELEKEIAAGLIKPLDPDTAPRYMKYIPVWA